MNRVSLKNEFPEEEFVKFESINIERANDIARRYQTKDYKVTRAEIILTNRCNLNCTYCKFHQDRNEKEKVISDKILLNAIKEWLDSGCDFVHITGGEATLSDSLYEVVKLCSSYKIQTTLSTNGTSDLEVYRRLVELGVNSFHVSLDTLDPELFDLQVGVKGAFAKVIKTIQLITSMRDIEGYPTKVVINTCINVKNFKDLNRILDYLLDLKPNDIKLIPIAQLKDKWVEYEKFYEDGYKDSLKSIVEKKLQEFVELYNFQLDTDFIMLRERLETLVKKSFRGYNTRTNIPPCYLAADERTIDPAGNYYGCYINYREGGKAIGNIM